MTNHFQKQATEAAGVPSADIARRRRRRHAADLRFRIYGLLAISLTLGLLGLLIGTLLWSGLPAFTQTHVRVTFDISTDLVDPADPAAGDYPTIVRRAMTALIPGEHTAAELRAITGILTPNTRFILRDAVIADPAVIGHKLTLAVPASDPYDQLNKGLGDPDAPQERRRLTDQQIGWFGVLQAEGLVSRPFNTGLFLNHDSRFPEVAGLRGAIIGTVYTLFVAFLLSVPAGIAAAIYLEEFAPRNRLSDIVEVNINNLAAVPSIIFGLLGLVVFIQTLGLPRSAPLVGGMVLALIILPTIIIVTRNALRAVPLSIREAAYGVGASRHQVVMHHVLPLAAPGILTGTIIGLARAFGETAPLLLIGMNAFITSAPDSVVDASTTLPTQIFMWADSAERGFVSRTSAAILVMLGFLIIMNAVAIFLRNRLERTW